MLDSVDLKIIECLQDNARSQWKEIGTKVHLTGQAVADRVHCMEDLGIIEGYTVKLDESKIGIQMIAFINIFMKTNNHAAFQTLFAGKKEVREIHRLSGNGCYSLKACVSSQEHLNQLLDEILPFGNYSLSVSIGKIK
jgi:Lrp/AsnC family leucine-responsive transcriptional regulator